MSTVAHVDQNATLHPYGSKYIEELSKRKAESCEVIKAYQTDIAYSRKMQRMRDCASVLTSCGDWNHDTGEISLTSIRTRYCGDPYCSICQWRRWWKWCCVLKRAIPPILAQHQTALPYMLTLTVRNCPVMEIRQTVTAMGRAWSRLVRRKEFIAVLGWVRTIEITKADDGTAHPHYHCLLLLDTPKPVDWQRAWQASLSVPYTPVVKSEIIIHDACVDNALKYMVKLSDDLTSDQTWFLTMVKQTAGMHRIATGGLLRNAFGQKKKLGDNGVLSDKVSVDKWRWDEGEGYIHYT